MTNETFRDEYDSYIDAVKDNIESTDLEEVRLTSGSDMNAESQAAQSAHTRIVGGSSTAHSSMNWWGPVAGGSVGGAMSPMLWWGPISGGSVSAMSPMHWWEEQ